MLYLFCNDRDGGQFLEEAISFCAERELPLTLVHSKRGGRLSRSYWRDRLFGGARAESRRLGVPVMLVGDVNADAFRNDVTPVDDGLIVGFNQIYSANLGGPICAAEQTVTGFKRRSGWVTKSS